MSPSLEEFARWWPQSPWLVATLTLIAVVYTRGWLKFHRRDPGRWGVARLAAFLGGLATIYVALASPIEAFASVLLWSHMAQHLLLMLIAPPLVWLGWPAFPLIRGLPKPVRAYWAAPLLRSRALRRALGALTFPVVAWLLFVATTWFWHAPPVYELCLANDYWHYAQHACFFASAMQFWYPVIRPYPARPRWSPWLLFPYLVLADVQNTVLAAWLTFSSRVLYPYYLKVPRIGGLTALEDQQLAGVLMWVPGSVALLLPLFCVAVAYLMGGQHSARAYSAASRRASASMKTSLVTSKLFVAAGKPQ